MRIRVQRSGGLANIPRVVEIDTSTLPEEEARELEQLVKQADLPRMAGARATPGRLRDSFQYDVTVEEGGGAQHTLTTYQGAGPAELQRLIDRVMRLQGRSSGPTP